MKIPSLTGTKHSQILNQKENNKELFCSRQKPKHTFHERKTPTHRRLLIHSRKRTRIFVSFHHDNVHLCQ